MQFRRIEFHCVKGYVQIEAFTFGGLWTVKPKKGFETEVITKMSEL